jgi:hypothetical protein
MDIGSTMDLFVTTLELAGVPIPKDREIDGIHNFNTMTIVVDIHVTRQVSVCCQHYLVLVL